MYSGCIEPIAMISFPGGGWTFQPGIHLGGLSGEFTCGTWLLENGGQGAILETPPARPGEDPVAAMQRLLKMLPRAVKIQWILLSHSHSDHTESLERFHRAWPQAKILVHESYLEDRGFCWLLRRQPGLPIRQFSGAQCVLDLGGEPLVLLHTPKHSQTDTTIIFRGVACTGDWWLGAGDPFPALVPHNVAAESVQRVINFCSQYHVHACFSGHGNDFRTDLDFAGLMEETRDWHQKQSEVKGVHPLKSRGILERIGLGF